MNMEYRTILELIQVFILYTLSVYYVPSIVFRKYLRHKTLSSKFIICTLIGNFYIVNVVFLIFLLHIPGRLTLYLFTIIPLVLAWIKINKPHIRDFFTLLSTSVSRLFLGEAKIRTILNTILAQPKRRLQENLHNIFSHIRHHFIEWLMLLGILGFDIWYYGYQTVTKYVYGTSDLVVHHEWINQMDDGIIFYNGIYPFGFHNIIYFLHNFFGMELTPILRVFGVIAMLFIHIMLYLLLRKVCRSRYVPILGLFLFSIPYIFNFQGTMRYQWTLPQEFAMVFLYPSAYFLIQFFERKKEELKKEKELKKQNKLYAWMEQYSIRPSTRSLIFCGISFALTLAIHFYITIIAIFLLLAIFLGYFPFAFHRRYFLPIAAAAILSVCSAVLPMGIGYLQGTDIEGSLRWALSAMSPGESGTGTESTSQTAPKKSDSNNTDSSDSQESEEKADKFSDNIVIRVIQKFNKKAGDVLINVYVMLEIIQPILIALEIMLLLLAILICIKRKTYYQNLWGVCIYMFFMIMLMCASEFSLPSVMDQARARLFLTYATPLFFGCVADIFYTILCRPFRYHRFAEVLPIGLTIALLYLTISNNLVKPLNIIYALQHPGEMKCNYQVMDNYPDNSWTIVTTTNSYAQTRQHGYHYEVGTFLEKMENYSEYKSVTIPSKYVFFYIEKYPINYGAFNLVTQPVTTTGYISEDAAREEVKFSGSDIYASENRYKLESRFFYWAKAFEKEYPREFQVYYEDEHFICYRIIQNEYHLYNFAIDYEFNR